MQCILEPEGGLPKAIAYSRPSFLQFLKTFVQACTLACPLIGSYQSTCKDPWCLILECMTAFGRSHASSFESFWLVCRMP